MLSFFPPGVLDEILNLIESVLGIFLPTLLYNNENKKIGENRCLVYLNDLVLFRSVILSL